jgi:protein TonB
MESKINYRALSMDEIVFDNRNKNYGAFILRQKADRNQLRALFIVGGFFVSAFLIPTLLKSLGLFAETIQKKEIIISKFFDDKIFDKVDTKKTDIKDPPKATQTNKHLTDDEREMLASKDTAEIEKVDEKKPNPNEQLVGSINGTTTATTIIPSLGGPGGGNGTAKPSRGPYEGTGFLGEMPSFIGGPDAFDQFVEKHVVYPTRAIEDDIEGTCEIRFVVNADGSLEQFSISSSSQDRDLDAAALALVKKLPKYNPGRQNGQAVRVWCVIPITFTLK